MRKSEFGKKYFAKIAACILVVAGLSISTAYASEIVSGKTCTLTLCIDESGSYAKDLAEVNLNAKLYKVADVNGDGTYTALTAYEGLGLETAFTAEAEEATFYWSSFWNGVAKDAADIVTGETAENETENTTAISPDYSFTLKNTGAQESIAQGMYLVMVDDVSANGSDYTFSPILVCLPTNPYLMNVSEDVADDAYWYEVTATLKPELDLEYGSLEIVKTLTSYNTSLKDVTFVFLIEATDESGNVIYSNVASTTHSAAGTKSAIVEEVPIGVDITVTEVYSGASYTVSGESTKTTKVSAEEMAQVEFTNTYDDKLIPGYGVVNHFEKSEEEGWTWTQLTDNSQVNE